MISRLVIIVLSIETAVRNFSSLDSQLNLALLYWFFLANFPRQKVLTFT